MRFFIKSTSLFLLIATVGCGSFPVNPPLDKFDSQVGYRFENLQLGAKNSEDLFVILTFSGGGTRAAALSYGVLKALKQTRIQWKGEQKSLLDEVDMISSVSGGSFTSAYYALHRKAIFDGEYEKVFLKHDIQGDLKSSALNPANWLDLAGSSFSRSDLAAEYYNEKIFKGATFDALVKMNSRPFLMINATDMSLGSQFLFIQDQFDLFCSDLSRLNIARAVAASSAFPGLLSPLTFKNYAGHCDFVDYPWVTTAEKDRRLNVERSKRAEDRRSYYEVDTDESREYIHLIDGGVSDNIGLRGPLHALSSLDPTYSILRSINNREIKKVLVIVVNAATSPDSDRDREAEVPGVFDTLYSAATIPIDKFSAAITTLLKRHFQIYNNAFESLNQCDAMLKQSCGKSSLKPKQLPAVDLYVSEVAFSFLADPLERRKFQNVGTNFHLSDEEVDSVVEVGCRLLAGDPDFKKLIAGDTGFTDSRVTGTLPVCQ